MKKIIVVLLSLVIFLSCDNLKEDLNEVKYENPIKFAFMASFGKVRASAESMFLGAYLAVEEINKSGGVFGRPIELLQIDDEGSVEKGLEIVKDLKKNGVEIIVGPMWSSVTLGIANGYTIANNMLIISYSATSPLITNLNDNSLVWRTVPSDAFQGIASASYLSDEKGVKKVSILYSEDAWSEGVSSSFENAFELKGGAVLGKVKYPKLSEDELKHYDFTGMLKDVLKDKPEALFLGAYVSDALKITNDLINSGIFNETYHPFIIVGDALANNDFLVNANTSILNNVIGTLPTVNWADENVKVFYKKYNSKWGFNPQGFNANAYDAVYLLAYSIAAAGGSTKPEDITKEIRKISDDKGEIININEFEKGLSVLKNGGDISYSGASGRLELDENGDPSIAIYKVWNVVNRGINTLSIIRLHNARYN